MIITNLLKLLKEKKRATFDTKRVIFELAVRLLFGVVYLPQFLWFCAR